MTSKVRKFDDGVVLPDHFVGERPIDRDKLAMVPRSEAAHSAHLTLFQLQSRENPEEIVLGVATAFAALCLRCNLDAGEMFNMGKRVLNAKPEGDHVTDNSLQSLQDFVSGRLMAHKGVTIA